MTQLPLEFLRRNETGVVACVDGDNAMTHRLAEMGLREGTSVRMLQPGRPCIVDIDGCRLTFRLDDSAMVLVDVCQPTTAPAVTPACELA